MTATKPIIRQQGEGEHLWFAGGGIWTMKATAAETNGAFLMFEDRMTKGKTTPLHVHPNEDEAIYVLDGELLVHVEGEEHVVAAGGLFVAPRGLPHAFLVTSDSAHVLAIQTPGTGEPFYREVSDPVESDQELGRPPDFDRLRAAAQRADSIELLGPPPFTEVRQSSAAAR